MGVGFGPPPETARTKEADMAKLINAITTIIEWDAEMGRMLILNPGDEGEAGDTLANSKIDENSAEEVEEKAKAPAPSQSSPTDELKATRERYAEVLGKKAHHKWSIEELNEKIAAFQAEAQAKADADAAAAAEAAQQSGGEQQDGEGAGEQAQGEGSQTGDEGAPA